MMMLCCRHWALFTQLAANGCRTGGIDGSARLGAPSAVIAASAAGMAHCGATSTRCMLPLNLFWQHNSIFICSQHHLTFQTWSAAVPATKPLKGNLETSCDWLQG